MTSDTALPVDLEKRIATAIFDPGATEGYKGDRTLTEWQTAAVMRVLSPAADLTPQEILMAHVNATFPLAVAAGLHVGIKITEAPPITTEGE